MTSTKQKNKNTKNDASSTVDVGVILRKKWWITSLVIAFALGGIILLYIFLPAVANKARADAIIRIPAHATSDMVRDSIAKYLGDSYANTVTRLGNLRSGDYTKRHGAFKIDSGMSPWKAERILKVGKQEPVVVVINAAKGMDMFADRVSKKLDFTADSLKQQMKDAAFLKEYGLTPNQALALFIDDSYQVYWNSTPKGFAEKMGQHFKKVWNQERLDKAKALGLSPAEVMVLASIVDEETNKMDEKPMVARLYLNRLAQNMKLQADPTVKFALGDFALRRIRNEHLQVESPYNTYKVTGLPPGPIRTVTVKDIDAVLNAPQHDYIYMCAKEDFSGYHNFAKDYGTHMANARRYQKALNQRKIY